MRAVFPTLLLALLALTAVQAQTYPDETDVNRVPIDMSAFSVGLRSATVVGDVFYIGGSYFAKVSNGVTTSLSSSYNTGSGSASMVVYSMTPVVNGVFFAGSVTTHAVISWDTATDLPYRIAGSSVGFQNGVGTAARFNYPQAIAMNDAVDTLYLTDKNNNRIRRITATTSTAVNGAEVFSFAGTGSSGGVDNTNGTQATFPSPQGIALVTIQGVDYLYVTSDTASSIRRIEVSTTATTTVSTATPLPAAGFALGVRNDNSLWIGSNTAVHILSWNTAGTAHHLHQANNGVTTLDFVTLRNGSTTAWVASMTTNKVELLEEIQPPTPVPPVCSCDGALTADYGNTLVPDAAQDATTSITLDTNTWQVRFTVSGIRSISNGHVIAAPVDARQNATDALSGLTATYSTGDLWTGSQCALGPIDTPAAGLGIAAAVGNNCRRSYTIEYSLINPAGRTTHCQLSNTANNEVLVECELQLNSIRAYDGTMPNAILAKETVFRTNITMPRNLPNKVSTLLHASLAKCSVYAAPEYYVDCRIPALWNFASTFSVTQSPSWIVDSSCVQTNGTDATYVRCDLQSISQIFTEATATIAATVLPSGEIMNFNVNYSLPREETATATGSLASFVKSIGTKDGKFYYGNDDLLTLEIEVVDTARLQITQLELFNSDSPVQSYNLRTTAEFETVETQNATFFVITFYPARKLDDSNFYRHGPHGVNVSFLFTAARRQAGAPQAGDEGVVTYSGIGLKAPKNNGAAQGNSNANSNASGLSQTAVAAIAAGALVAVVAVVAATVMIVRSNKKVSAAKGPHAQGCKEASSSQVDVAEV